MAGLALPIFSMSIITRYAYYKGGQVAFVAELSTAFANKVVSNYRMWTFPMPDRDGNEY